MTHHHPNPRRYTFPEAFRLKRKRLIRPLFDRSRDDVTTIAVGCIRIVYRVVARSATEINTPLQIGFTTGRGFKRAVDRNRLKRHMREAFRLNQHLITDLFFHDTEHLLTLMVIFRGNVRMARRQIPIDLPAAFHLLAEKIQEGSIPD